MSLYYTVSQKRPRYYSFMTLTNVGRFSKWQQFYCKFLAESKGEKFENPPAFGKVMNKKISLVFFDLHCIWLVTQYCGVEVNHPERLIPPEQTNGYSPTQCSDSCTIHDMISRTPSRTVFSCLSDMYLFKFSAKRGRLCQGRAPTGGRTERTCVQ